jgi:hypothetical protein
MKRNRVSDMLRNGEGVETIQVETVRSHRRMKPERNRYTDFRS